MARRGTEKISFSSTSRAISGMFLGDMRRDPMSENSASESCGDGGGILPPGVFSIRFDPLFDGIRFLPEIISHDLGISSTHFYANPGGGRKRRGYFYGVLRGLRHRIVASLPPPSIGFFERESRMLETNPLPDEQ